nr:Holliday junction resolvase RuvX [Deinobacterium chartae]
MLALDVSDARIGFAVSRGRLAFARGYLQRTRQSEDVARVLETMQAEGARQLVLGLPLRTDGQPSPQAQKVQAFGRALRQAGVGVFYQDERFTTQAARQDLGRSASKGEIDAQSAVRILEMFLMRHGDGA